MPPARWFAALFPLAALAPFGCGEEPLPPDETEEEPFEHAEPTPYEPEVTPPSPTASFTTEEFAALAPELTQLAATFDPEQVLEIYRSLMLHSDGVCPAIEEQTTPDGTTTTQWFDACLAEDGTYFYGAVTFTEYDNVVEGSGTRGFVLSGNGIVMQIYTPEGQFIYGSPYLVLEETVEPGEATFTTYLIGTLRTDAGLAAGNPWLLGQIAGDHVEYAAEYYGGGFDGVHVQYFDGDYVAAGNEMVTAFSLNELIVENYTCAPLSITGAISLRDREGGWHDADFGDGEVLDPEEICDACGELTFSDESIGTACSSEPEFGALLDWETKPW
jgi:hypothetical protein